MREDKLGNLSTELSVDVLQLTKELRAKHENVISNQIGRSGTSIGANIREAQYAHGKADFTAKLQIALKEANETGYYCIKQTTLPKANTKRLIPLARVSE